MNYLSHYVVDCRSGNPYYNTGLILPDFAKQWIPNFRTSPLKRLSVEQTQLLEGALKHYQSDKIFHASSFFSHYQEIVNGKLKSLPFSELLTRKWFIGHVLTELLIDRSIVQNFPELTDAFYDNLNKSDSVELDGLFSAFGVHDSAPFLDIFNHFRQVKYIYYYADNNKFLYSLSRIMMRVGLPEMTEPDQRLMLKGILEIEEQLLPTGEQLLEELKNVFV